MLIVRTPLRIGFVGGGSDLPAYYEKKPGMVVSSAIDKFVYVIVKGRFDDEIYVNYSKKECVDHVDDIKHDLVREAMRIAGVEKGVEITTLADVPSAGSGLGSSSSVTVALLHALHSYNYHLVTAEQLAQEACRIEIDILGKPIGRQDQYAAAYGGVNQFIFNKDHTVDRIPLDLDNEVFRSFYSSLLLYYTGITRKADAILSEQSRTTTAEEKFAAMTEMVGLVEPFKAAVEAGDIRECGRLLDKNWELKQKMASGISNPQINEMYQAAKEAGALGGKIAGAGGGGFLILAVQRESQQAVFQAMRDYRELPFMLERSGSQVIFDHRGYPTK
ncbi:GHMP kinase [Desulfatibacillum aliphaticivorans]|uniref:GHMP family kinase ATP-binding protein n=1 Tax=Desulfatibacillum aliphaticivorans TaxID=218208 RepID=UPI0004073F33|nr:GHMP kinase [Desulfatibacillum aliphaticivorans]